MNLLLSRVSRAYPFLSAAIAHRHGGTTTCSTPPGPGLGSASQSRAISHYKNMYDSLLELYSNSDGGSMSVTNFITDLLATGLRSDDPRLQSTMEKLQAEAQVTEPSFMEAVSGNMPLIEMALTGKFIIPEFKDFTSQINSIFEECKDITEGETAKYIPELARVDTNLWGMSICTINGQRHSFGDSQSPFTMQSGSKCFTYGITVEEYDSNFVHKYIGKEPSGQSFNSLFLNSEGKPHNPMVNAGAMVLASLIRDRPHDSITDSFNFVLQKFCEMAGVPNRSIKCDIMTCDSEMETAHRNYALLHYMKDMQGFPAKVDLEDLLKFYTRLCSVELDCERGAVMAATLANYGHCPITGTKVLSTDTVCHTLSLMHSCGMYDSAGEFSFSVGLPAKSGISGVIFLVVPNVMGVCLYSPLVNKNGNSLKGLHFCERLVENFNFHSYDSSVPHGRKTDPRRKKGEHKELEVTSIMYAAQAGALSTLQRYKMAGMDLSQCNYDGRSPLHVAAAEGHYVIVEMLLDYPNTDINWKDRWSRTALDEALHFGHHDVATLLEQRGGRKIIHHLAN